MKMKHWLISIIALFIAVNVLKAQQNNFSDDYSGYLPEIRAYNKSLKSFPNIPLTPELVKIVRKMMEKHVKTISQASQIDIEGLYGKIGLRILRPDKIEAVYLYIHGGGNIWGNASSEDSLNDITARYCHVAIVSVDYHLAPEYPFPAQINDCYSAAKWLVKNAFTEFGTDRFFIGGGSAGAHLSALTAIYVRDSLKSIDKVLGVNLFYGLYDLGKTPSHRNATDSTLGLNKHLLDEILKMGYGSFSFEERQSPKYSPLYANLKNLPPAIFIIGTADPLLDDSYFMEARWRNAGNKTYLGVYPECVHGFNTVPLKISKLANDKVNEWMKRLISGK